MSASSSRTTSARRGHRTLLYVRLPGPTGRPHTGALRHQEAGTAAATHVPDGSCASGRPATSYGGGKYAGGPRGKGLSVGSGQEAAVVQAVTLLARAFLP